MDEGDEPKIAFEQGKESAGPTAVAGAEDGKFAGSSGAEERHELALLDDGLADSLGVADEIRGDGEFAVERFFRRAGVVVGQVWKCGAPAVVVEPRREPAVAVVARAHEGVEDENSRGVLVAGGEKTNAGAVVLWMAGGVGGVPFDPAVFQAGPLGGRHAVEFLAQHRCMPGDVARQFLARAGVGAATPLEGVHHIAHRAVHEPGEGFLEKRAHGSRIRS